MNLDAIAEEMSEVSEKLVVTGMVHLLGGNFSVREGNKMAITGHRSAKKTLTGKDLFVADVHSGEPVEGASSTLGMHRSIFRKTKAAAIIHAHPYYATLISYFTNVICPIDENNIYYLGEKVFCIQSEGYMKWALLADQMADLLTHSPAAVLKWHGSFTIGDSLAEAYNHTQALDQAARLILDTRRLQGHNLGHRCYPTMRGSIRLKNQVILPVRGSVDRSVIAGGAPHACPEPFGFAQDKLRRRAPVCRHGSPPRCGVLRMET